MTHKDTLRVITMTRGLESNSENLYWIGHESYPMTRDPMTHEVQTVTSVETMDNFIGQAMISTL